MSVNDMYVLGMHSVASSLWRATENKKFDCVTVMLKPLKPMNETATRDHLWDSCLLLRELCGSRQRPNLLCRWSALDWSHHPDMVLYHGGPTLAVQPGQLSSSMDNGEDDVGLAVTNSSVLSSLWDTSIVGHCLIASGFGNTGAL